MRRIIIFLLAFSLNVGFIFFIPVSGISQARKPKSTPQPETRHAKKNNQGVKKTLYGQASYYHQKFHGRKTASGKLFSQQKLTAACNVLPLGTRIRVTNLRNYKSVIVTVNDRLNKKTKRLVDLTYKAANTLGFIKRGLTRVKVEVL